MISLAPAKLTPVQSRALAIGLLVAAVALALGVLLLPVVCSTSTTTTRSNR